MENAECQKLAWMAGVVDGGGCIAVSKVTRRRSSHPEYKMLLRINVAEGQNISMFSEKFGGKAYLIKALTDSSRPYSAWMIYGRAASNALEAMLPFLVWKRSRAELAIRFQEGCKTDRSRLTAEEVGRRELFYLTMRALNFRGKTAPLEPDVATKEVKT